MERADLPVEHWIVQTKLQPPRLRPEWVARPHWLHTLHDALINHRLTLISAPAGYDKTTSLTALPRMFPDLRLAWLSLDRGDNDLTSFLAALIAAMQRLDPQCGATALSLLPNLSTPHAELRRIIGVVINDVLRTIHQPFA